MTREEIEKLARFLALEALSEGTVIYDHLVSEIAAALTRVREETIDAVLDILNCGGTSCPRPCRAMCSNPAHRAIRALSKKESK